MPDRDARDTLDVCLAGGRADLLDSIEQPPLARIRERAAERRRRRRSVRAGGAAALLAVAVGATLATGPWSDAADPPVPPVAEAPPGGPVYTAAGITINGLTEPNVAEVPGTITDVEFTDPDTGYLLAQCLAGPPCPASVGRTGDGGLTWRQATLPADSQGRGGLDLVAFPEGRLVVTGAGGAYASPDGGRTWRSAGPEDQAPPAGASPDDVLRPGPSAGGGEFDIEVWRPGFLRAGSPPARPDLAVRWVAPAAGADGAWWVGGTRDGGAAVAVTRDRGAHWRTVGLPGSVGSVGSVEVASLGSHAYAAVLDDDRRVLALFHSADGGGTFTRTRSGRVGAPEGLAGAPVPLLDGRLLITGTDQRWYVSGDDGATFTRAEGNLPIVGRLARTPAGFVAFDLFGGGWAAYSNDGATWRKLQIN